MVSAPPHNQPNQPTNNLGAFITPLVSNWGGDKQKNMIIVNVYYEEDYNPATDGYHLILAGIVNDSLDLDVDPQLIKDAIDNDTNFNPKAGQFYEIQLIRGTIASDPIPEPAFAIDRIIEKIYDIDCGWITPLVRM